MELHTYLGVPVSQNKEIRWLRRQGSRHGDASRIAHVWPATGLRSSVHGEEDPQVGICREEGVRKVGSGRKRAERKR